MTTITADLVSGYRVDITNERHRWTADEPPEHGGGDAGPSPYERAIAHRFGVADRGRPADGWLLETVRWAWRTRVLVHLELDLRSRLRAAAEDDAVAVFAGSFRRWHGVESAVREPTVSRCGAVGLLLADFRTPASLGPGPGRQPLLPRTEPSRFGLT